MRFVRKHYRVFVTAAIFVMCLLIFYVFWQLQVAEARSKSRSFFLNDEQQAATAPLEAGAEVSQLFSCDTPFHAIGVAPTYTGAAAGSLQVAVYGMDGTLLATAEGNAAHTLPGQYASFVFPETLAQPDGQYRLVLTARLEAGSAPLALAKSAAALPGWQLQEGGRPAGGSLCLQLAHDRIGSFLTGFYWVFAVAVSLFLAGLYLLFSFKVGTVKLFAVAAGGLCLLFNLILPVYSSPDEVFHINETYNLSSWFMGQAPAPSQLPWGTTVRRASDHNELIETKDTTVYSYREIVSTMFTKTEDSTPTTYPREGVGGYNLMYWPTALVVTLCRLLGLGFTPTLLLGRLFNGAVYVAAATLAVKLAPTGKGIFAAVALLPMSMHLAASYSRDNFTLAFYLLYTAILLRYIIEKPKIDWPQMAVLALFALLLAPAKIVYAPVMLLLVLIPWQQFHFRGRPLPRWAGYAVKALLVFISFWHLYGQLFGMAGDLLNGLAAGVAAPAETAATGAAAATAGNVPNFGVRDFLRHPGQMLFLVARTFLNQFTFYLKSLVGGILGYYSLPLNDIFPIACLFLLFLAALPEPNQPALTRRQRGFGGGMSLLVLAFVVGGCILWTPITFTEIYGIQGRYLLPALPLALCCASGRWAGLTKTKPLVRPVILGFAGVGSFALLNTFLLILER